MGEPCKSTIIISKGKLHNNFFILLKNTTTNLNKNKSMISYVINAKCILTLLVYRFIFGQLFFGQRTSIY